MQVKKEMPTWFLRPSTVRSGRQKIFLFFFYFEVRKKNTFANCGNIFTTLQNIWNNYTLQHVLPTLLSQLHEGGSYIVA